MLVSFLIKRAKPLLVVLWSSALGYSGLQGPGRILSDGSDVRRLQWPVWDGPRLHQLWQIAVHSIVLCESVWMPNEDRYFCGKECVVAHNQKKVHAHGPDRVVLVRKEGGV